MVGRRHAIQQGSHGRFLRRGERRDREGVRDLETKAVEEKETPACYKGRQQMCTGGVLHLLAAAEDIAYQDPKDRPAQMLEC